MFLVCSQEATAAEVLQAADQVDLLAQSCLFGNQQASGFKSVHDASKGHQSGKVGQLNCRLFGTTD